MSGDRGNSFPAAGLAIVALFLSTTFFAPRGFELLRQAETDGKRLQLSEPAVEARLWEDPLAALRRHRDKQKELCKKESLFARPSEACAKVSPNSSEVFVGSFSTDADVTVIAAILPGAAFVGGEEARRRYRYALLSGLNAAGYVPDDSERMGLVNLSTCAAFAECTNKRTKSEAVYETLRDKEGRRSIVLWLDDKQLGERWLTATTTLLEEWRRLRDGSTGTSAKPWRLRVIGPPSSDDLVGGLNDLSRLAEEAREAAKVDTQRAAFFDHLRLLQRIQVMSPNSTAAATQLLSRTVRLDGNVDSNSASEQQRPDVARIREAFAVRLDSIAGALDIPYGATRGFFTSTIGTDNLSIDRLVKELCMRGLDARADGKSNRVVLIGEWDSIYARSFSEALRTRLEDKSKSACGARQVDVDFVSYQYLRGLDGLTLEGAQPHTRPAVDSRKGDKKEGPPIEWAEGREQRDYVRRLLEMRLGNNYEGRPRDAVQAVGIIGSDVHDKLVLAQAIRSAFPDRTFFTTDLDARLLHPDVLEYTRNLVVASSLPLTLGTDLQCGAPPFRDTYQTAMFLAARLAAAVDGPAAPPSSSSGRSDAAAGHSTSCGVLNAGEIQARIDSEIKKAGLFEIGRHGVITLADGNAPPPDRDRLRCGLLAALVLLLLAGVMIFFMPGSAMQAARTWIGGGTEQPDWTIVFFVALQMAALAFASGVVIEVLEPGIAGMPGATFLAMLAVCITVIAFMVRDHHAAASAAIVNDSGRRRWFVAVLVLALGGAAGCAVWWSKMREIDDLREPFALLSGVSAWPSQLLRTLVIVLFAWFLDYAWRRTILQSRKIEEEYFPDGQDADLAPSLPEVRAGWRGALKNSGRWARAFLDAFTWRWSAKPNAGDHVDGAALWREYQRRFLSGPKVIRIAVGYAIAVLLITGVTALLGGALPEVPARGVADRELFLLTGYIGFAAVVIMMVLVTDATILTSRFISLLKGGRTFYPDATVARFADELGALPAKEAIIRVAAKPADRGKPLSVATVNSPLDDWIDARLLARHTAVIGPLIVFPFVLLALMIVARSQFFDNWEIGGVVLITFVALVLWSVAMAAWLNHSAEQARQVALDRMQRELVWLTGAGPGYEKLAASFPRLIEQVRTLRQGAFAPFFEQPLVQAILVPLGGAGGIQLLDLVMQGRLG